MSQLGASIPCCLHPGDEAWRISPCGGSSLGGLCLWPVRRRWVPGGDCGARLGICLLVGIAQMWYPSGASASQWCSSPTGILARLHWARWTPEQGRCRSVRGALALSLQNDDEGMNCTILSVYGVWQDWELKGIKLDNSWCSSSWHPLQGHNMNKLGCGKVNIQPWACQVFSLPLKSIKVTGFECKSLK